MVEYKKHKINIGDIMNTKRLVTLSILLSMSITLNLVEIFFLPPTQIPGVKFGLANIVTLIILYTYGEKDAFTLVILRIFLVALIRGTLFAPTLGLSLFGGIVAYIVMVVIKNMKIFSPISVSVMGSLGHSVGQIAFAIFLLNTANLIYYLPFIIALSIPAGLFTGVVASNFINKYGNLIKQKG